MPIVPWAALCQVIEPHYPKAGNGRPPIGLERMLRIHFLQHWFNLADLACEEALYDSASLRRFVGIDLGRERVPDATTLLKFRNCSMSTNWAKPCLPRGRPAIAGARLQGQYRHHRGCHHHRSAQFYQERRQGARPRHAPDPQRPAMVFRHEAAHWGGQPNGLAHSAVVTAANVHDKHPLPDLLHGNERRVYGDSAYASQKTLIASKAPGPKDFTNQRTRRAGGWTKFSGPRTATNRGCALGSSMSLRWSSACGDSPRQGALSRAAKERHACVHGLGAGQHLPCRGHCRDRCGDNTPLRAWWRVAAGPAMRRPYSSPVSLTTTPEQIAALRRAIPGGGEQPEAGETWR